jgi:hypothetical protein
MVGEIKLSTKPKKPEPTKSQPQIFGSFGTSIASGYFDEEYLSELKGQAGADIFDKMRRNDPQISMIIHAIKNPILAANWEIHPWTQDEDDPEFEEQEKFKDFIEFVLFEDMSRPWHSLLPEVFTFPFFGFSMFWVVHKNVKNHPTWQNYTGIHSLNFRSQRTIDTWNVDKDTGELISVKQFATGDLESIEEMDANFLLIFTLGKEGANYEGISLLRPCYGPWWLKQTYLNLEAIGIEKHAIGTPIGTVPRGAEDNSNEINRFVSILESFVAHESGYVLKPEGWELEILEGKFNASSIQEAIKQKDESIARAVCANFLNLGQGSAGGAYALGTDLSDFFLSGIESIANIPCEIINQKLIPSIIKLNFGEQAHYPYMTVSGINDKAGKELAEIYQILTNSGAIKSGEDDEAHFRNRLGLPERDMSEDDANEEIERKAKEEALRNLPPPGFGQSRDEIPSNEEPAEVQEVEDKTQVQASIQFAEKPRSLMVSGAKSLENLMKENISFIANKYVADTIKNYKRLSENQKARATKGVKIGGLAKYRKRLRSAMINLAVQSYQGVLAENPKIKPVKFADIDGPFSKRDFEKLPEEVRAKIAADSSDIVNVHAGDIEKQVKLQFSSSLNSTKDPDILAQDMLNSVDEKILAPQSTGAVITASKVVNEARHSFFFQPEVLDQIESFTFTNPDPVTDICQSLVGKTFAARDSSSLRYEPPLHHNCKSFLVANPVGSGKLEKAKEKDGDGSLRVRPINGKTVDQIENQITLSGGQIHAD